MARKRYITEGRFVDADGRLTWEARLLLQSLLARAETQADVSAVSDPPTQAEVNAIVSAFNALVDKLQAAGLME